MTPFFIDTNMITRLVETDEDFAALKDYFNDVHGHCEIFEVCYRVTVEHFYGWDGKYGCPSFSAYESDIGLGNLAEFIDGFNN